MIRWLISSCDTLCSPPPWPWLISSWPGCSLLSCFVFEHRRVHCQEVEHCRGDVQRAWCNVLNGSILASILSSLGTKLNSACTFYANTQLSTHSKLWTLCSMVYSNFVCHMTELHSLKLGNFAKKEEISRMLAELYCETGHVKHHVSTWNTPHGTE